MLLDLDAYQNLISGEESPNVLNNENVFLDKVRKYHQDGAKIVSGTVIYNPNHDSYNLDIIKTVIPDNAKLSKYKSIVDFNENVRYNYYKTYLRRDEILQYIINFEKLNYDLLFQSQIYYLEENKFFIELRFHRDDFRAYPFIKLKNIYYDIVLQHINEQLLIMLDKLLVNKEDDQKSELLNANITDLLKLNNDVFEQHTIFSNNRNPVALFYEKINLSIFNILITIYEKYSSLISIKVFSTSFKFTSTDFKFDENGFANKIFTAVKSYFFEINIEITAQNEAIKLLLDLAIRSTDFTINFNGSLNFYAFSVYTKKLKSDFLNEIQFNNDKRLFSQTLRESYFKNLLEFFETMKTYVSKLEYINKDKSITQFDVFNNAIYSGALLDYGKQPIQIVAKSLDAYFKLMFHFFNEINVVLVEKQFKLNLIDHTPASSRFIPIQTISPNAENHFNKHGFNMEDLLDYLYNVKGTSYRTEALDYFLAARDAFKATYPPRGKSKWGDDFIFQINFQIEREKFILDKKFTDLKSAEMAFLNHINSNSNTIEQPAAQTSKIDSKSETNVVFKWNGKINLLVDLFNRFRFDHKVKLGGKEVSLLEAKDSDVVDFLLNKFVDVQGVPFERATIVRYVGKNRNDKAPKPHKALKTPEIDNKYLSIAKQEIPNKKKTSISSLKSKSKEKSPE